MFNIYYDKTDVQFDLLLNLQQRNIPLHSLTQCKRTCTTKFHVVNNGEVDKLIDVPIIFPIDYQSTMISWEKRDCNLVGINPLGEEILLFVKNMVEKIPNHKKIFLIYSRTEPYFHDNHLFVCKLADMYPDCEFVVSGNGEQVCHYEMNLAEFNKRSNTHFIPKSWYIDQVHFVKHVTDDVSLQEWHYEEWVEKPPADAPSWAIGHNRFLLTMRNPRPHRLLMSALIEDNLEHITYSRQWSMNELHLMDMYENPETTKEYPYHVDLLVRGIKRLLDTHTDPDVINKMLHTLYGPPHFLDTTTISDRGLPGKWLYERNDIAVVAGGEGEGYGYIDEKQIIPIAYKRPFILFGCKGMYEELEKLGFKTFGNIFNIEYSKRDDFYRRIKGCAELIEHYSKLSNEQFEALLDSCKEDVEYNYNHYASGKFRLKSNDNFFRELENACS